MIKHSTAKNCQLNYNLPIHSRTFKVMKINAKKYSRGWSKLVNKVGQAYALYTPKAQLSVYHITKSLQNNYTVRQGKRSRFQTNPFFYTKSESIRNHHIHDK